MNRLRLWLSFRLSSFLRLWNFHQKVNLGRSLRLGSDRRLLLPEWPSLSSLWGSCKSFLFYWQAHGFEETQATFLQTDLLKLLVKKCSKGTGFSKTWLLRDLEVRDEGASCCRATGLGVEAPVSQGQRGPVHCTLSWAVVCPRFGNRDCDTVFPCQGKWTQCLFKGYWKRSILWKHTIDHYILVIKCALELLFPFQVPLS